MENEFLKRTLPFFKQGHPIQLGPGDDCAAISYGKKELLLLSADQLVAGIHFDPVITTPKQAAVKLLRRNLSDIAAMGGTPSFALLTVAAKFAKNGITMLWLEEFFKSIANEAKKWNVSICGGDISSSKAGDTVFTMTICGFVDRKNILLRSGAHNGHLIYVTGSFGNSYSSGHHLSFCPRLAEGKFIAENKFATAMIDVSDGLLLDLSRICLASGIGAKIDTSKIPLRKGANLAQALGDGEDYELIFAVPSAKSVKLEKSWHFKKVPLTQIGTFSCEVRKGEIIDQTGRILNKTIKMGYEHFY